MLLLLLLLLLLLPYLTPQAYVPILPTLAKHSRPSATAENAGLTFQSSQAPVLDLYSKPRHVSPSSASHND